MEKTSKRIQKNKRKNFLGFVLGVLVFLNPLWAFAANLEIRPVIGTYKQNTNFSVTVNVSSPEQAMNAASARITFPTDKLQVVSISKSGSIVDFWAQEPTFSNSIGEIKLEGVVLTPGYKGDSGKLLTITFKGKSTGLANVRIGSSAILANDGIGTSILRNVTNAVFTITEPVEEKPEVIKIEDLKPITEETPVVDENEACEPDSIITSSTHPGVVWRRENSAAFSWDIDKDTLASKISFDNNPDTEPTHINSPAIVEKRYENVEDGIWYFHLSLQNNSGWSKTEHFKIKIDHTPPTIEAEEIKRSDLTDPKPIISVKFEDKTSCVKNFELSINNEKIEYEKLPNGNIKLETISPGEHELVITAYDRAGNKNETFIPIVVKALEAPKVTSYPAEIMLGETLTIKAETIPNGNVESRITSKKNNFLMQEEFQSGSGKFTFEQKDLRKGTVFVSFRVSDGRGALSNWSTPIEVKVKSNSPIPFDEIAESLGIEFVIAGFLIIIIAIVLITRALTIRRIKRNLGM